MRSIMPTSKLPDLHLLLPFALPSAADAATALHKLDRPALDRLLARATLNERVVGEDFQRTLPHERWIARQFGVVTRHPDKPPTKRRSRPICCLPTAERQATPSGHASNQCTYGSRVIIWS